MELNEILFLVIKIVLGLFLLFTIISVFFGRITKKNNPQHTFQPAYIPEYKQGVYVNPIPITHDCIGGGCAQYGSVSGCKNPKICVNLINKPKPIRMSRIQLSESYYN